MRVARRETEDEKRIQWMEFELGKRILLRAKTHISFAEDEVLFEEDGEYFEDGFDFICEHLVVHFGWNVPSFR